MHDKKRASILIVWVILIITLIKTVNAESWWYLPYYLPTMDIMNFYYTFYGWIDFLIFFMIFASISRVAFEKKFGEDNKGITALYLGLGFMLAFALTMWELNRGLSLVNWGPIALLILLAVIILKVWSLFKTGDKKEGIGIGLLLLILLILASLFFPEAIQWIPFIDKIWALLFVGGLVLLIYYLLKWLISLTGGGSGGGGGPTPYGPRGGTGGGSGGGGGPTPQPTPVRCNVTIQIKPQTSNDTYSIGDNIELDVIIIPPTRGFIKIMWNLNGVWKTQRIGTSQNVDTKLLGGAGKKTFKVFVIKDGIVVGTDQKIINLVESGLDDDERVEHEVTIQVAPQRNNKTYVMGEEIELNAIVVPLGEFRTAWYIDGKLFKKEKSTSFKFNTNIFGSAGIKRIRVLVIKYKRIGKSVVVGQSETSITIVKPTVLREPNGENGEENKEKINVAITEAKINGKPTKINVEGNKKILFAGVNSRIELIGAIIKDKNKILTGLIWGDKPQIENGILKGLTPVSLGNKLEFVINGKGVAGFVLCGFIQEGNNKKIRLDLSDIIIINSLDEGKGRPDSGGATIKVTGGTLSEADKARIAYKNVLEGRGFSKEPKQLTTGEPWIFFDEQKGFKSGEEHWIDYDEPFMFSIRMNDPDNKIESVAFFLHSIRTVEPEYLGLLTNMDLKEKKQFVYTFKKEKFKNETYSVFAIARNEKGEKYVFNNRIVHDEIKIRLVDKKEKANEKDITPYIKFLGKEINFKNSRQDFPDRFRIKMNQYYIIEGDILEAKEFIGSWFVESESQIQHKGKQIDGITLTYENENNIKARFIVTKPGVYFINFIATVAYEGSSSIRIAVETVGEESKPGEVKSRTEPNISVRFGGRLQSNQVYSVAYDRELELPVILKDNNNKYLFVNFFALPELNSEFKLRLLGYLKKEGIEQERIGPFVFKFTKKEFGIFNEQFPRYRIYVVASETKMNGKGVLAKLTGSSEYTISDLEKFPYRDKIIIRLYEEKA